MIVFAVQRLSDNAYLTKRQKANLKMGEDGWCQRSWSNVAPDLWTRRQAARAAADAVADKTRLVAFRLEEVSE